MNDTRSFNKVVRIGTMTLRGYSVFCKIGFAKGRLSISGVEGPLRNGDAIGGCGQIEMSLGEELDSITPAPGWDRETIARFFELWRRWHLNDMRAGSAAQMAYLRDYPIPKEEYAYPKSHFEVAGAKLAAAGLNPDADGYEYGHAWKFEAVPDRVLAFFESLPVTDQQPAWV